MGEQINVPSCRFKTHQQIPENDTNQYYVVCLRKQNRATFMAGREGRLLGEMF